MGRSWPFPLYFCLYYNFNSNYKLDYNCSLLDSNWCPLASEATGLPKLGTTPTMLSIVWLQWENIQQTLVDILGSNPGPVIPEPLKNNLRNFWSQFKHGIGIHKTPTLCTRVSLSAQIHNQVSKTGLVLVQVQLMVPKVNHNVGEFH